MRYFEDFKVGEVIEGGARTITRDEIVAFAREFDPQPFHTDEAAARETMYGGLIASGWHSGSLMMRLFYESLIGHSASMGSPGIDELRWLKPVRPGDTLRLRTTVLEVIESRSKPDRGLVRTLCELRNQDGEVVMSIKPVNFFRRRSAGGAGAAGQTR
jgi:acyl dehydratase